MRTAADAIKKATDGRVEIKYYPGGVMGGRRHGFCARSRSASCRAARSPAARATVITPDAQVYSLPFLYRSQDEIDKLRAKLDPLLKQEFAAAGYDLLGIQAAGGFAYLFSTRDIKTRDDLKAAKVWVPQGDKAAEVTFKVAGVTPDSAAAVGRLHQPADRAG